MAGDFPLTNKIVLVTGGGSDLQLGEEARQLVESQKNVHFETCDVRRWKDLRGPIDISVRIWNDVPDVYIAGAGVFEPKWSNFWQDPEDETYDSIAINVNHPMKLTRIAIQALLSRNKKGVVCIIGSIAGLAGNYAVPLYCASKHAVTGFVRSMAPCEELEGVKITAMCPWYDIYPTTKRDFGLIATTDMLSSAVKTPLWTNQPDKMDQFNLDGAETVTAAQVGEAIVSLVEDGQYKGGTVLEITAYGDSSNPRMEYLTNTHQINWTCLPS
ncbi:NAD(P)-binding protein [Penicillium manginii]|uniref:NAD(P)-binding protein n=1 Tax=Penicillium manginii TaxID=203109 RepID=UPI0025490C41|nr:NAD(P)-binding protein [Penicillium manginii]KAJ5767452.1 NAD(P)-binding protein [Penicillium manginii]